MKVHLTCSSGERRWFEIKASVLDSLFIIAYVDINSDVMLQEELKKANSSNDMMLSILGHDLRSPLANLYTMASLAENRDLSPDEFVPMMRQIREESSRVLQLLETSFSWARLNFNSLQLKPVLIDFPLLVSEVAGGVKLSCERKNITISTDLEQLENIETDFDILMVIVRNLVSNAVKFTPFNGRISITSSPWELVISDNGKGMDIDKLSAIKNQALPGRGTDGETGSALGLQLVMSLAEKIGCRLEIQSGEAQGTAVSIIFKH
ncbi:sensor histidine kinase [Flavobacterium gelatinilyticum]|uniref:sensor histidine kinase n=1 Tax=Flavobacterium gelatinilyticum TaxID=3003260 RepID=UPI00248056BE|nr:HAMP domain-containing sensor histidine kinase [Flavobacterium gelatinilyticum]